MSALRYKYTYIINTVNIGKKNFYDLLIDNDFDFAARSKNYITESSLAEICSEIGNIKDKIEVIQEISISEWIKYHCSNHDDCERIFTVLNNFSEVQLSDYGIFTKVDGYYLPRCQHIYRIQNTNLK